MSPDFTAEDQPPGVGEPSPDGWPDSGGVESIPRSPHHSHETPSFEIQPELAENGSEATEAGAALPDDRNNGGGPATKDPENKVQVGLALSQGERQRPPTRAEVAFALREAKGNRKLAAAALGISAGWLKEMISKDAQLKALYGGTCTEYDLPRPGLHESTTRTAKDIPAQEEIDAKAMIPEDVELTDVITTEDSAHFRKGLKNMGVSERMLKKIKNLDGLAKSGGQFLAASLKMTHGLYVFQLTKLDEQIDGILDDLNNDRIETDPKKKMSHEDRSYLLNCYATLVQESARGYRLNLQGTKAMVDMIRAAREKTGGQTNKKPGWGLAKVKAVTATGA